MPRLRKHVERLRPLQVVAVLGQHAQVAGQGGRFTRHVDDTRRTQVDQCSQRLPIDASAWRVEQHGVPRLAGDLRAA